jgi:hypothetical protein
MNLLAVALALLSLGGCVEAQRSEVTHHFDANQCESVLTIVVDQSGSFANHWDDKALKLFLELMDQFFTEGDPDACRIVIGQLSESKDVVLFEGRPEELRAKFRTPQELSDFLRRSANPVGSQVYRATEQAIRYVSAMPGVTEDTRLMTVILSDLVDSSVGDERNQAGARMLDALTSYRKQGGGLALYYVAKEETPRWQEILGRAGFEPGSYVIESTLVAHPQLPRFE